MLHACLQVQAFLPPTQHSPNKLQVRPSTTSSPLNRGNTRILLGYSLKEWCCSQNDQASFLSPAPERLPAACTVWRPLGAVAGRARRRASRWEFGTSRRAARSPPSLHRWAPEDPKKNPKKHNCGGLTSVRCQRVPVSLTMSCAQVGNLMIYIYIYMYVFIYI